MDSLSTSGCEIALSRPYQFAKRGRLFSLSNKIIAIALESAPINIRTRILTRVVGIANINRRFDAMTT